MTHNSQAHTGGPTSIGLAVVLTIFTCGLYGLFWQYRQMQTLNDWLGRYEYSFIGWFLLCLITCGIYGIYYEYKMAKGINEVQEHLGQPLSKDLAVLSIILTIFGLGIISTAIQQADINRFYAA